MIEPKLGIDYHISDYGDKVELTATVFYGLIGGIYHLAEKGYKVHYEAATVSGMMYIVTAEKTSKDSFVKNQVTMLNETIEELEEELDEIKEQSEKEINDLRIENRTLKTQLTKMKNKYEKQEKK